MRLKGKVALITGASRNIGRAVAIAYAREGADIALWAREQSEQLHVTASECETAGARVLELLGDVGDQGEVARLAGDAERWMGKIDVLVSSVAIRPHTPFPALTFDEWRRAMSVNLDATFHLCKAIVPGMIERRSGSIIAFGGLVSLTGVADAAATSASKTGLLGLIRALAAELGQFGVRANLVVPGNVNTQRANPEWYRTLREPIATGDVSRIALRRLGHADEIAAACVFLGSDDSSYVTGSQLICNGGSFIT